MSNAAERVAEFLRQLPMGQGGDHELLGSIWFDANTGRAELLASDLHTILDELEKLTEPAHLFNELFTDDVDEAAVILEWTSQERKLGILNWPPRITLFTGATDEETVIVDLDPADHVQLSTAPGGGLSISPTNFGAATVKPVKG